MGARLLYGDIAHFFTLVELVDGANGALLDRPADHVQPPVVKLYENSSPNRQCSILRKKAFSVVNLFVRDAGYAKGGLWCYRPLQ